jgi:integrase
VDGSEALDWYCRISGVRLPEPSDPAFFAKLAEARKPKSAHEIGSLGRALASWRASPEYRALAKATKFARARYTAPLEALGHIPLPGLKRGQIMEIRDGYALAGKPGAANVFVSATVSFLSWCLDRGLIEHHPGLKIKPIKNGHFQAWTEDEARFAMSDFREPERRIIVLAYHTGQRRGDLVSMKWSDYDGKRIRVRQQKTKTELVIPASRELQAELASWEKTSIFMLTTINGQPWIDVYSSRVVRRQCVKHGMRPGLNIHGLRKLAAARLAEAGCSASEIAAITGHKSLSMVSLYTASASQENLAEAALKRLSQGVSQNGTNAKRGRKIIPLKAV